MSYQIVANFTGQIGVNPRVVRVITEDSFDVVISPGYITNSTAQTQQIYPTDIVLVRYSDGVGFFSPLFSGGVITLSPSAAIPADSVGTEQLQDEAVTTAKIADDSITNIKIEDLAVGTLKIANGAVSTVKILNANVTLAKLAAGITPSHIIVAAGDILTAPGGSASMLYNVAGVIPSDQVIVTMRGIGTVTGLTILSSAPSTGQISVIFSENPLADSRITYQVLRAAA